MKIVKLTSLGEMRTYSPQMAAPYHNYILNNKVHANSHAVAYCLIAYRCLWLKAHYPAEWWATVMSWCDTKKLDRFMNSARSEDVKFGNIDVKRLSKNFTVVDGVVTPGLLGIKKVGESLAAPYIDDQDQHYESIDDFIEKRGKKHEPKPGVTPTKPKPNSTNKVIMERLIKLGAFRHIHENARATWLWYSYFYGDMDNGTIKKEFPELYIPELNINKTIEKILLDRQWNEKTIEAEKMRQIAEFKAMYPKRNKIPAKIANFKPVIAKAQTLRDTVMAMVKDYTITDLLAFEKEYLGYYWHSPTERYDLNKANSIANAKKVYKVMQAIEDLEDKGIIMLINAATKTTDKSKIEKIKSKMEEILTGEEAWAVNRYISTRGRIMIEGAISNIQEAKTKSGSRMCRLVVTDGKDETMLMLWEQTIKTFGVFDKDNGWKIGTGIRADVRYDMVRNSFTLANNISIALANPKSSD